MLFKGNYIIDILFHIILFKRVEERKKLLTINRRVNHTGHSPQRSAVMNAVLARWIDWCIKLYLSSPCRSFDKETCGTGQRTRFYQVCTICHHTSTQEKRRNTWKERAGWWWVWLVFDNTGRRKVREEHYNQHKNWQSSLVWYLLNFIFSVELIWLEPCYFCSGSNIASYFARL